MIDTNLIPKSPMPYSHNPEIKISVDTLTLSNFKDELNYIKYKFESLCELDKDEFEFMLRLKNTYTFCDSTYRNKLFIEGGFNKNVIEIFTDYYVTFYRTKKNVFWYGSGIYFPEYDFCTGGKLYDSGMIYVDFGEKIYFKSSFFKYPK